MPTGLIFPTNTDDLVDNNTHSVRFKWANPHLNGLPIYGPSGRGVTYIWRYRPAQQNLYYTTFFWGNDDGVGTIESTFQWQGGPSGTANTYYGAHPYPDWGQPGNHKWEISVEQTDYLGASFDVTKDVWHAQAFVAWGASGVNKQHTFYWDLPNVDSGHKLAYTSASGSYGDTNPPSPALTFGDAPWNPGAESLCGIFRSLAIYNDKLSEADILSELNSPLSTVAGAASIWYLNLNPTPDDITDKSGNGHDPSWVSAYRPTLYTLPENFSGGGLSGEFLRRRFGRNL